MEVNKSLCKAAKLYHIERMSIQRIRMPFCGNCGISIEDNLKFCKNCGMPVHSPETSSNDASAVDARTGIYSPQSRSSFPFEIALPAVALGLLLLSIITPWLVFNILGQQLTLSPADVIRAIFNSDTDQTVQPSQTPDLSTVTSRYRTAGTAIGLSALCLPTSLAMFAASFATKKYRLSFVLAGGLFAMLSSVGWIFGIESLKSSIMADSSEAGILGGALASVITSAIGIGSGVYLVIAAGITGLITLPIVRRTE